MSDLIILLWVFATFIWSVKDINDRIEIDGVRWYYIPLFLANFIFMPIFATIEKVTKTNDYIESIRKLF